MISFNLKQLRVFVTLCLRGLKQFILFSETQRHEDTEAQRKTKKIKSKYFVSS
jgi:hypothetical protein